MPVVLDALDWLAATRTKGGGWGYRREVPDDADSTAWAALALRAWRRPVPGQARNILSSCRIGEGGVATYPAHTAPARGWARAAPDVTAVVLRTRPAHAQALGDSYFSRWVSDDGLIPAYWWASRLYTRAMLLECPSLRQPALAAFRETLTKFQPAGAFELALLLRCQLRLGLNGAAIAGEVVAEQRHDGSWSPSALLRLSRPEIAQPWRTIDSGPLFPDICGVFTTATVVAALGRLLRHPRTGLRVADH